MLVCPVFAKLHSRRCLCSVSHTTPTHSFARTQISTPLFSSDSALFAQNTRGWGRGGAVEFLKKNFKYQHGSPDCRTALNAQTKEESPLVTRSVLASSSLTTGNSKRITSLSIQRRK